MHISGEVVGRCHEEKLTWRVPEILLDLGLVESPRMARCLQYCQERLPKYENATTSGEISGKTDDRGGVLRDAAILTRSAKETACIFRMMWPRWNLTVCSVLPSSPAICLFSNPETTRPITSRSRGVRESKRRFKSRSFVCSVRAASSRLSASCKASIRS